MGITSYAQNFEDVMLWRALQHVKGGLYIDVGAQDPVVDSVSMAFHEHGWAGIHVEPTERYADMLRKARPNDQVIQAAAGKKAGQIEFFEIADSGLSTSSAEIAEQHRQRGFQVSQIRVPVVTLSSIFRSCGQRDVHWLKIDVEGHERECLEGWGKSKRRPWVVVIESTMPMTMIESHAAWEDLVIARGYRLVYRDGLNRFYVSNEHRELEDAFSSPPNIFDDFQLRTTPQTVWLRTENAELRSALERAEQLSPKATELENQLKQSTDAHLRRESALALQMSAAHARMARETQEWHVRERALVQQQVEQQQAAERYRARVQEREKALLQQRLDQQQATETHNASLLALHQARLAEVEAEAARDSERREQAVAAQAIALDAARVAHAEEIHRLQREWMGQLESQASDRAKQLALIEEISQRKVMQLDRKLQQVERALETERDGGAARTARLAVLRRLNKSMYTHYRELSAQMEAERNRERRLLVVQNDELAARLKETETASAATRVELEHLHEKRVSELTRKFDDDRTRFEEQATSLVRQVNDLARAKNIRDAEIVAVRMSLTRAARELQTIKLSRWWSAFQVASATGRGLGFRATLAEVRLDDVKCGVRDVAHMDSADVGPLAQVRDGEKKMSEISEFALVESNRYELRQFLSLWDREFIEASARAILLLPVESDEVQYFLRRLRAGASREAILVEMLKTPLGKASNAEVTGLSAYRRVDSLMRIPILGGFLSAMLFLANVRRHLQDLRALENYVSRLPHHEGK
jgi:FkbM family methyltransferase